MFVLALTLVIVTLFTLPADAKKKKKKSLVACLEDAGTKCDSKNCERCMRPESCCECKPGYVVARKGGRGICVKKPVETFEDFVMVPAPAPQF